MAISVVLGGITYTIPSPGESNSWGAKLNAYLVALGAAAGGAKSPVTLTFGGTQTENAVRYLNVGGASPFPSVGGTIATAPQLASVPCAGTISRLDVQFSENLASNSGTIVFTVQKLVGATVTDQAMAVTLTCSPAAGTKAHVSTTTGGFTVAAGDAVSIKVLDSGLSAAVKTFVATLSLTPS